MRDELTEVSKLLSCFLLVKQKYKHKHNKLELVLIISCSIYYKKGQEDDDQVETMYLAPTFSTRTYWAEVVFNL